MAARNGYIKKLLPFFLMVFTVLFFLNFSQSLDIFPLNETFFEFSTVADTSNSWAEYDSSHGHLHFRYQLGDEASEAKLLLHAHDLDRTIDLSKYQYLEIETDPNDNGDFAVVLYMYIPGFSDPSDMTTHRPYAFKCRADSKNACFKLNLSDFATPIDWFTRMGVTADELPKTDWSRMSHMAISDFSGSPSESPRALAITGARFSSSLKRASIPAGAGAVTFSVLLQMFMSGLRKKRTARVKRKIYRNVSSVVSSNNTDSLVQYLEKEFGNPMLTLDLIEQELGIKQQEANMYIRKKYDMGYKQFLNRLRMDEAKRLLRESSLPIATIGERVGYLHATSFARTFRTIENIAPNEYRRNQRSGKKSDDR